MGSTQGKGMGGPGPPSEEQDKQVISNSGGDNTPMRQPGRQEDESGVTTNSNSVPYRVPYRHGGGWSRKINAWHLYTLMVYL
jgi:hypothetical protein